MTEYQRDLDRRKVADFLNKAESGAVKAGLSDAQKQKVNEYVVQQRDEYANAALRAKSGGLDKTSPGYLEAVQQMNQVKSNLENLALQQKAIGDNQQQYLDDVNEGRVSEANYIDGKNNGLADIYSGAASMQIDDFGNINFEVDGEYKPYTNLANYYLKSTDTANNILNIFDKLADSKKPFSQAKMGMVINNLESILNGADRSDVVSLIKDDLLPGFKNMNIPEELFQVDNLPQLKEFLLDTMTNAANDINSNNIENINILNNPSSTSSPSDTKTKQGKIGGKTIEERQAIAKALKSLEATGSYQGSDKIEFSFKGTNDPNSTRYEMFYNSSNAGEGPGFYFRNKSSANNQAVKISPEDLSEELGLPIELFSSKTTTNNTTSNTNASENSQSNEPGSSVDNPAEWTPSSQTTTPTFKNVDRASLDRMTIQGSAGSNKANILRDGKPITSKKSGITVTGVRAQGNDVVVDAKFLGINQTGDLGRFKQSGNGFKFVPGKDYKKLGQSPKDKKDFDNFVRAVESDPAFAAEVLASVKGNKDFSPKNY